MRFAGMALAAVVAQFRCIIINVGRQQIRRPICMTRKSY